MSSTNFSIWIARRLRLRGHGGSAAGVVIAVAGVALAVMIMELTLAIVTGFKDGIRERLSGFDAQVTVMAPQNGLVRYSAALQSVLNNTLPGADVRLAMRKPALLKTDTDFEGIIFIAQSPTADFSFEKGNIVAGRWPDYSVDSTRNHIVISAATADALGIAPGDRITSAFFVDGNVKMRRHTIAGIYRSNFGEYDRTVAYASLGAMQSVAGADSLCGDRIDIRGLATDRIEEAAALLQDALVGAAASGKLDSFYPVDNIKHSGAVYFNWLSLLDTNVLVIFILMLCVAGLTLVSSLFILILERVRMIGILRAMGATRNIIRSIFIDTAMRLVGKGMIIGNVLGIGIMLIQKYTHIIPLDPEMYYLASVPVEIRPLDIILLNIGVALAAWLILVLPARVASSFEPAKTIKYD